MSMLGSYKECNTICKCHDCRIIDKVPCNPCMDCIGKHHLSKDIVDHDYIIDGNASTGYYNKDEECKFRNKCLNKRVKERL